MKKVLKKFIPLLMAVIVLFQTVYSSVETAKAAALPEVIYYTYWDLISSLYGVCGYDTKIDESVINNHSVTGKQAWDNFVTFVENSAKANYKFLEDGASKAFSELENLVNNVTDKGFSITQDLYDMLKSVFADQVANSGVRNQFDVSSVDKIESELLVWTNAVGYSRSDKLRDLAWNIYRGDVLNIIYDGYGSYMCFLCDKPLYIDIEDDEHSFPFKYYDNDGDLVSLTTTLYYVFSSSKSVACSSSVYVTVGSAYSWIVKRGAFVGTDTIGAQVSEGACPKEVPEVVPWRKEVTVPDEWRVIPGGGSDDDPDKNPDALPVVIPIKPTPGKDPDSTEDPSTETPEDPDKKDDPDKKKDPVVNPIINPDTGNVVDPNTGWDIDPSTGMLINPNTGELVNPDTSNTVSNASKFGDITKLFPFCIPFDFVKLIKGMSAEKAPPVFHFEHRFKGINYTFVVDVDLSDYDKYIKIFRFGLQVLFVITLMFLTVKFSKLFS